MPKWRRTLKRSIEFAGVGLHSGQFTRIRLSPAQSIDPISAPGIAFRNEKHVQLPPIRVAPHAIDASASVLCTQLKAEDSSWRVSTVEHLMAALVAARVTCANVSVVEAAVPSAVEIPILDGSALPFAQAIQQIGTQELDDGERPSYLRILRPVQVLKQDKAAWLLPIPPASQDNRAPTLHVSVQVNFGHKGLGSQFYQFSLTDDPNENLQRFVEEVAPARTFTFEEEIAWMQANNLALGGSLENAVVFASDQSTADNSPRVLNPDGLRFPRDEWVRHKLLDCVGDLGLVGLPIHGYFFSSSPGHALTHELIHKLYEDAANYTLEQL